jgi:GT2 family glycosyltransferase
MNEQIAAIVAAQTHYPSLNRCLNSLRLLLSNPFNLIFVDNGSRENLGRWVAKRISDITIIRLDENKFFCGGT